MIKVRETLVIGRALNGHQNVSKDASSTLLLKFIENKLSLTYRLLFFNNKKLKESFLELLHRLNLDKIFRSSGTVVYSVYIGLD